MARLKLAALDTIFLFYQNIFIFFKENGCYIHINVWMSFLVEVVSAFYLKNRSSVKKIYCDVPRFFFKALITSYRTLPSTEMIFYRRLFFPTEVVFLARRL